MARTCSVPTKTIAGCDRGPIELVAKDIDCSTSHVTWWRQHAAEMVAPVDQVYSAQVLGLQQGEVCGP